MTELETDFRTRIFTDRGSLALETCPAGATLDEARRIALARSDRAGRHLKATEVHECSGEQCDTVTHRRWRREGALWVEISERGSLERHRLNLLREAEYIAKVMVVVEATEVSLAWIGLPPAERDIVQGRPGEARWSWCRSVDWRGRTCAIPSDPQVELEAIDIGVRWSAWGNTHHWYSTMDRRRDDGGRFTGFVAMRDGVVPLPDELVALIRVAALKLPVSCGLCAAGLCCYMPRKVGSAP